MVVVAAGRGDGDLGLCGWSDGGRKASGFRQWERCMVGVLGDEVADVVEADSGCTVDDARAFA